MNLDIHLHPATQRWLRDSPLTPYVIGYFNHLVQCRYSIQAARNYINGIAHLGRWMAQSHIPIDQIGESTVSQFLDEHLPVCDCPRPAFRSRPELRAACAHLLRLLRDQDAIPAPATPTTPADEEVGRFDEHLCKVRGLAVETRRNYRRIVRCLLDARFGTAEVDFPALRPADVRRFVAGQMEHRPTASNASAIAAALHALPALSGHLRQ
jgi:integrase/recombinase XerC